MTQHSSIGASSMERWSNCPGSVALSEGMPNVSSSYADEGTKAHEYAEMWLNGQEPHAPDAPKDMLPAVKVFVDTVRGDMEEGDQLWVERRVDLSQIHPKLFGTADALVYKPKKKLLICYDYKHGAGIPVEVKDNKQEKYYALGAWMNLKLDVKRVELVVVQPRCFHSGGDVRRWQFPISTLYDFAYELGEAAEATDDPNAPLKEGPWCRFCPAATNCPEMDKQALAVADEVFAPEKGYDPDRLARQLNFIPSLKAWISNLEEFAFQEANQGRVAPGFKLVAKAGRRNWTDPEAVTKWADTNGLGELAFTDPKLLSPAQMEKIIHKRIKPEMDKLVTKVSSGEDLVPESDKRSAVDVLSVFD